MSITTSDGTVISYDSISPSYTTIASQMANLRTQSSDDTWYYNGIQFGSQSSGSGNEDYPTDYWSKTDFQSDTVNYKDQVISKISTNQNDIIEFLVKNSLTPEALKRLHVQLSNDGIIT